MFPWLIRMGRNLPAPLTNGHQQRSNHLVFLETENEPPQRSPPRTSSGLATERHPKERTKRSGKIESSAEALKKLQVHVDDDTCPRSLRYNARANITADKEFKREVSSIRKKAERQIVTSLVKFHHRRTERLSIKLRKLQQAKSSRKNTVRNVNLAQPPTRINSVQNSDVHRLADTLKAKISEVDEVLRNVIKTAPENKRCESYPRLLSDSFEIRGKAKDKFRKQKPVFNRKRKERRRNKGKMRYNNTIESHKKTRQKRVKRSTNR